MSNTEEKPVAFAFVVEEIDPRDFQTKRANVNLDQKKKELYQAIDNLEVNTGFTVPTTHLSYNAIKNTVNKFNQDGYKLSPKKNARIIVLEDNDEKVVGVKIARVD